MFIILVGSILLTIGFLFIILTSMHPIFRIIYLDWIGASIISLAWIITIYRLWITDSLLLVDKPKRNKSLLAYLRRDGSAIPVIGRRVYSGESFLDIPGLGLVEDLGKDCVYTWGDKKIRFVLENLNYTADMRYANFTAELYKLGFTDNISVYKTLQGEDLELMAKTYLHMLRYMRKKGGYKLVEELIREEPVEKIKFKPLEKQKREEIQDTHSNIDRLLSKIEGSKTKNIEKKKGGVWWR